jgi:hypothetical protein
MGNKKPAVLIGSFIILAAALCLAPRLQRTGDRGTSSKSGAAGGGAGIVGYTSKVSGNPAAANALPGSSKLTSHATVVAGGAGAGKARLNLNSPPTQGVPSEVLQAAAAGLPFFLGQIPVGSKGLYGFSSQDDLSKARLGGALRMQTITPAALGRSSPSITVSAILSDTTMWFFPILLESASKAMLVVDREGGTWKAVSLGYAGLGHELNELLAQWPESKGFHPQLVAVFQAKQFYFTVPEIDDLNLTKITLPQGGFSGSARPAQSGNYGKLTELSRSLQELKPIVLRAEMYPTR